MAADSSTMYQVYAFGSNGLGQLGIGHYEDVSVPQQCLIGLPKSPGQNIHEARSHVVDAVVQPLELDSGVKSIVAGGNHTLLLTNEGEVFASGRSHDGRCGFVSGSEEHPAFHRVRLPSSNESPIVLKEDSRSITRVTHIAATWEASFFVLNDRSVFVCGTGNKGELGLGPATQTSTALHHIVDVHRLEECDTGDEDVKILQIVGSMNHVVLLTSNGMLYGWGHSRKGQLGLENQKEGVVWQIRRLRIPFKAMNVLVGRTFTLVLGKNSEHMLLGTFNSSIDQFACDDISTATCSGWSSVYKLVNGRVYCQGRNDRGQLPLSDLPSLNLLASGSEHCIACTDHGEVIAWGWGEHGNCGEQVDRRGNVAGTYNTIPLPSAMEVVQLGAGCATSFVVLAVKAQSKRPLT